ncbi:hypothetical protein WCX49_00645 [Sulfurimonas sp. HSL-1656]|uniref:hypothetical protein n=1 Tax=Thiomicrolovo subterrani TaxID=3131934 RepID=UPI0031F8F145
MISSFIRVLLANGMRNYNAFFFAAAIPQTVRAFVSAPHSKIYPETAKMAYGKKEKEADTP